MNKVKQIYSVLLKLLLVLLIMITLGQTKNLRHINGQENFSWLMGVLELTLIFFSAEAHGIVFVISKF